MRVVLQRCKEASCTVDGKITGQIDHGYVALVGFTNGDNETICEKMADKVVGLRVFTDENDKMNLNILTTGGSILSISQFTLYADASHGRRPSFIEALNPAEATRLYDYFNQCLAKQVHVETGIFQADMKIQLLNDGPVTIILDSKDVIR